MCRYLQQLEAESQKALCALGGENKRSSVSLSRYGLRNVAQVRNAGLWIQPRKTGDRWVTRHHKNTHPHTLQIHWSSSLLYISCLSPSLPGGSDSLLDKIQKAAEVVASAVLPPTEHQGIRLHDNHYRAVVAPSAPIEVAVPACAYNLPARRPKGETCRLEHGFIGLI